jgi:hypothetical protein
MRYRYEDPEEWGSNPHREALKQMNVRRCVECGRVFDLTNDDDAAEWVYGHDCE